MEAGTNNVEGFAPESLSLSERQLYEALTERFNSGLRSMS
jgi:hypothetical protein